MNDIIKNIPKKYHKMILDIEIIENYFDEEINRVKTLYTLNLEKGYYNVTLGTSISGTNLKELIERLKTEVDYIPNYK